MSENQACGEPKPASATFSVNLVTTDSSGTVIPSTFTPVTTPFAPNTSPAWQPMVGTDPVDWHSFPAVNQCADGHPIGDFLQEAGDEVVGICENCGIRVFIPKIPGAFSFERAGKFIGKAMSLDAEDDMGELLTELAELEDQIKRDQKRFQRALEILQIARGMAKKHAVKELAV